MYLRAQILKLEDFIHTHTHSRTSKKVSKVSDYKVNTQKSVVYLNNRNEHKIKLRK